MTDGQYPADPAPEGVGKVEMERKSRLTDESNEFILHLRVGYKTVLLIVVVFDLIHTSIQELVNREFIQNFLGNFLGN